MMVTGDDPGTARRSPAPSASPATRVLTGPEIAALADAELRARLRHPDLRPRHAPIRSCGSCRR
jgi:hypothetical protein